MGVTAFLLTSGIAANSFFALNEEKQTYTACTDIKMYTFEPVKNQTNIFTGDMIKNLKKLDSFTELEENWNGYDAEKISPELINKVRKVIYDLPVQPMVFPTGRKSIQLEYEKPDGEYLEFEIFEDRTVMLHIDGDNEDERNIDDDIISEEVIRFHACV